MCKHPKPKSHSSTVVDQQGAKPIISVVVPTLNDRANLQQLLPQLSDLGLPVVISDGGSTDNSMDLLLQADVHLVVGGPNRGEQLARGVAATSSPWVLFLHSDCSLSSSALAQLMSVVERSKPAWGRFDVTLEPQTLGLRSVAWFMNQRSHLTKICTGDQGMFMHRSLLSLVGGVPCQPLMEDIELSKRLKTTAAPFVRLPGPLLSSARRWQAQGVLRTVLSMWRFRLRYWLGASPAVLVDEYYSKAQDSDLNLV